jgi:hypothetical protein
VTVQQIGRKLRQQIHYFSGELCSGLGVVASRFVEEAIFGISSSGSVKLTELGRALEENIPLHATHKRLSRNLANTDLEHGVGRNILRLGAKRIKDDTLLIIDPSDVHKKYAQKMQYLAEVHDGSEKGIGKGYWLCEVVGCDVGSNEITPLAQELWSQKAPDFISENDQILSIVRRVREATGNKGILLYDRGGDRRKLLLPWTKDEQCRYMIRQRGDRHLSYRGANRECFALALSCKTPYAETLIKEKEGEEEIYHIQFGSLPVRLPEYPARPLWLVVVKGFGKEPLMILTTEPMRRSRKVLWRVVNAYITRWKVEETIRFIKQSYDFEDVRVLTYDRLRNMAVLVLGAAYFAAVWLGRRTKLTILARHALDAAKRLFGIPDFRYYALADGISNIYKRVGKGPLHPRGFAPTPSPQLSLW